MARTVRWSAEFFELEGAAECDGVTADGGQSWGRDTVFQATNILLFKKARLGKGSKAGHLSYLGDAEIGDNVNIGAGTITCNYDGVNKHKTVIGNDVFVGSDTQLVAPVTVGNNVTIAAGTTVTRDVPDNGLLLSRVPQVHKPDWQKPVKKK